MNYLEITEELDNVIKSSEKSGVEIVEKLEEILSIIKEEEPFNKVLDLMNRFQEEDIHRQKLERVLNAICVNENIDSSKYNIAPTAKHISGDEYDSMSQADIDALFNNK